MTLLEPTTKPTLLNRYVNKRWKLLDACPRGTEKQRGDAIIVPQSVSHFKTLESASKYAIHSKRGAPGTGLAIRRQIPLPLPSTPIPLETSKLQLGATRGGWHGARPACSIERSNSAVILHPSQLICSINSHRDWRVLFVLFVRSLKASSGPASSSYRGCSVPLGSPYCKQLGVSEQTAKIQCTFFLCVSDGKPRLNPPPPRVSIRASLLYRASRYKGRGENNLCIGVQTVTCGQHLG